jgi:cytochrome c nitrite reductase small subunit
MSSRSTRLFAVALLAAATSLGALIGVGGFTFSYASGASYLRTAPEACVNCHIMQPQYDAWQKGSHHAVAVCVDCHLPEAFVPKYLAKAENGWRHGKMFTLQSFKEPIEVGAAGKEILQANCQRCHAPLVDDLTHGGTATGKDELRCVHCHRTVGHGAPTGLGGPLQSAELVPHDPTTGKKP